MKISIVGTGKIVEEVLGMLSKEFAGKIEVTGILAREKSIERAVDLCEKYAQTGFVFTDMDRMMEEAEADFVYIANANHVHHQYAKRAIETGHNVIVEKPVAVNRVETEELYEIVKFWRSSRFFYLAAQLLIPSATVLQEYLNIYDSREKFIQMLPYIFRIGIVYLYPLKSCIPAKNPATQTWFRPDNPWL